MSRRRPSPEGAHARDADLASDADGGDRPDGTALAFPGQGVDPVDLAAVLAAHECSPLVARLATELGTDDWTALDLSDTRVSQPAVYVASCVSAAAPEHAAAVARVGVVFGHSLGELAAATFAGAFDEPSGFDVVRVRAELGHALQARRPGRMIVVMRLSEPEVELVRRQTTATGAGVLDLAVVNGSGQFVLSGDVELVDRATDLVASLGGVARPMMIGGAYHSGLMSEIVEPYRAAIDAAIVGAPTMPLVSCTRFTIVRTATELAAALATAPVLPVRWVETMRAVRAAGAGRAIDAGPSRTLTNLARFSPILEFESLRPEPG